MLRKEIETRLLFPRETFMKNVPTLPCRCPRWRRVRWLRFEDKRRKLSDEPETHLSSLSQPFAPHLLLFPRTGRGTQVFPCSPGRFRSASDNAAQRLSSRISVAKLINPSSVFPGGHPGKLGVSRTPEASHPIGRPPSSSFLERGGEEKERKKKEGKGREGRRGEGREEEGRGERGEKKGWKGKQNERRRGRGGEWTRGWVGGADGNGQQHSRGSPRGKFIP